MLMTGPCVWRRLDCHSGPGTFGTSFATAHHRLIISIRQRTIVSEPPCPKGNSRKLSRLSSPFQRTAPSSPRWMTNSMYAPQSFSFTYIDPLWLNRLVSFTHTVLFLLQARCALRSSLTHSLISLRSSHCRRCEYRETRYARLYGQGQVVRSPDINHATDLLTDRYDTPFGLSHFHISPTGMLGMGGREHRRRRRGPITSRSCSRSVAHVPPSRTIVTILTSNARFSEPRRRRRQEWPRNT